MLIAVTRALSLVQVILAVAHAAIPGAAKTTQYIDPAVAKAQAVLTSLSGFTTPANALAAVDELAQALTVLQQQGLIPPAASATGIEAVILKSDAALHNYLGGQAVPLTPVSVEGHAGFLYAIPNGSTVSDALGR